MQTGPRARRRRAAAALATILAGVVAFVTLGPAVADETPAMRTGADLVGSTDGFAVALEVSGDLQGSLETCGCPKHPMGGFAWRTGYTTALAKATKNAVSIVQVDAGRAFSDDVSPTGMADDVRIKNEWMLRSFDELGAVAINVAHADLAYLAPVMATDGYAARAKRFPALSKLISTNVVAKGAYTHPFPKFAIRTVTGKRLGGKPVRIGFLGVSEPPTDAVVKQHEGKLSLYTFEDPVDAVARALPELRKKADYIVVLAYVTRDVAKKLGALVDGPDVVVAAHQFPLFNKTDVQGTSTIAYVATQTKWLSELRLARMPADRTGKISIVDHRDVPLDEQTPADHEAAATVNAARSEFTAAQQIALARDAAGGGAVALEAQRTALAEASPFAGAESCKTCHSYAYDVWKKSQHSHAFRTLENRDRHRDAACTVCHSVRQGEPGGFLDVRLTPRLQDVQCESCHGPGKQHVLSPKEPGYGKVELPTQCVTCHTHENDPDFDLPSYWPKIKHADADAPDRAAE